MRVFFACKPSLVSTLVLAFILVSVTPMLVASNIATRLVYSSVNSNIEHWLRAATNYLLQTVNETVKEITALQTLLYKRVAQPEVAFSQEEIAALVNLDADFVLLNAADGKVLFATHPTYSIDKETLYPGSPLKWINFGNEYKELAIAVKNNFVAEDGRVRALEIACLFDIELAESNNGSKPIEVRIFLPEGNSLRQVYSSAPASLPPYSISAQAVTALRSGAAEYFIPDADWTDNIPNAHSLLLPIKNEQNEIQAVFVISAIMLPFDDSLPSSATLFLSFFIIGTALSGAIGYILAKKLVQPIKKLNEGVRGIAGGNLGQRVVAHGINEISELGSGFNLMAGQLEIMQHESQQSAYRERSRMLGEIALGFAHEIRNPLVVIKTSAEVVHSQLKDKPKEARLLGFVVEEVGRIDRLITEFLSFAKPTPLSLEYFHLRELSEEIIELSAAELTKRNIRCNFVNKAESKSGQGDRVLAERNKIRQVLLNLVLNAMDAMPEGGELTLRIYEDGRSGNDLPSTDATQCTAPRVCLEVKDTGVGVAGDILPTIHLPFISTKENGLGLGLAKVYAIIEEHGGTISCASKAGEGTIFTICLNG
jgi:signal transduction histidine kinase